MKKEITPEQIKIKKALRVMVKVALRILEAQKNGIKK